MTPFIGHAGKCKREDRLGVVRCWWQDLVLAPNEHEGITLGVMEMVHILIVVVVTRP